MDGSSKEIIFGMGKTEFFKVRRNRMKASLRGRVPDKLF